MPALNPAINIEQWPKAIAIANLSESALSDAVNFVYDNRWYSGLQVAGYDADGKMVAAVGASSFLSPNTEASNNSVLSTLKDKIKNVAGNVIIWFKCLDSQRWQFEGKLNEMNQGYNTQYINDGPDTMRGIYQDTMTARLAATAPEAAEAPKPTAGL